MSLLIKLQSWGVATLVLSCRSCKIFKNAYFGEHLGTAAFASYQNIGLWRLVEKCFFKQSSQSLSVPHRGNGVHLILLTDIAYLSDYEFQRVGWFLIGDAETRFQALFQPHIGPFFFQNYPIPYIPFDRNLWRSTHLKILFIKDFRF